MSEALLRDAPSYGCPATTDHAHRWQLLAYCGHVAEHGRGGYAVECPKCGAVGHRWTVRYAPLPPRPACIEQVLIPTADERAEQIADEHARCPVWVRLVEQAERETGNDFRTDC